VDADRASIRADRGGDPDRGDRQCEDDTHGDERAPASGPAARPRRSRSIGVGSPTGEASTAAPARSSSSIDPGLLLACREQAPQLPVRGVERGSDVPSRTPIVCAISA